MHYVCVAICLDTTTITYNILLQLLIYRCVDYPHKFPLWVYPSFVTRIEDWLFLKRLHHYKLLDPRLKCSPLLFCSHFTWWLCLYLSTFLWQHCSLTHWEGVLCHTYCHLMLILPSQFNPLCHTLWVCTRSWTVFYLRHHYGVLARWPCSW